ncbi:noelin-like [Lingula anatina]|uniref:Noelin-like n=1 Tax=Lingula anatina TaxID=7574 RepID=A0A1S3J2C4_LINAN|nr:noelin-like [Lingula anatina]|eukprot:XP_013404441.1 noelin-like [Lingula anatina]
MIELFHINHRLEYVTNQIAEDCPYFFAKREHYEKINKYVGKRGLVAEEDNINLELQLAKYSLEFMKQALLDCRRVNCSSESNIRIEKYSILFQYTTARSSYSAWMKDSQPLTPNEASKVYYFHGYSNNKVVVFDTFTAMKQGTQSASFTLPYSFAGTGHVVYWGNVYYRRLNTQNIIKYDPLKMKTIVKQVNDVDAGNTCRYAWGGYTTTDFAVDEYGLWLVYGNRSNICYLVIAKINPDTLDVEKSWETTIDIRGVGNTFMKCGVLYATNSYNAQSNYIRYTYDTNTGKQESLSSSKIPFRQPGTSNAMLDYNPHDGLLYYSDRTYGYLATFPIV